MHGWRSPLQRYWHEYKKVLHMRKRLAARQEQSQWRKAAGRRKGQVSSSEDEDSGEWGEEDEEEDGDGSGGEAEEQAVGHEGEEGDAEGAGGLRAG